jgi:hypothetical protein
MEISRSPRMVFITAHFIGKRLFRNYAGPFCRHDSRKFAPGDINGGHKRGDINGSLPILTTLPKPSPCASNSAVLPLRSTKRIPLSAGRLSSGFRPRIPPASGTRRVLMTKQYPTRLLALRPADELAKVFAVALCWSRNLFFRGYRDTPTPGGLYLDRRRLARLDHRHRRGGADSTKMNPVTPPPPQ